MSDLRLVTLYLWKFIQKVSQFRNSVLLMGSSREFALRRRREQDRERRARESAEERDARLSRRRIRDRQRTRERRASETAVQREVRLVSRRIRDRARRAEESEKWFKGHALKRQVQAFHKCNYCSLYKCLFRPIARLAQITLQGRSRSPTMLSILLVIILLLHTPK